MIRIACDTDPVVVTCAGASISLRRLRPGAFSGATEASSEILADDDRLEQTMDAHGLFPAGGVDEWRLLKAADPQRYAETMTGLGLWLGAVECAERAIVSWEGLIVEGGAPAPLNRRTVEALMLDPKFSEDILKAIDAARPVITETVQ